MHTGRVSRALAILAVAPVVFWLGCGGGSDLTGPPVGSLEITTATTGAEPDADGYGISVDGAAAETIAANTSRVVEGLSVGMHAVELSGVAANCALSGGSRLEVEVTASAVAAARFAIDCAPTTGSIVVTTATAGSPTDPDGYELALDGGAAQPIGTAATTTLNGVAAGPHTLALGGLAANCAVADDNPRTVEVDAGSTASVVIAVTCSPPTPPPAPGGIGVTTQTTGPDQDSDGYAVTVDGADGVAIGAAGTVALADLAPGAHSVGLTGVSANCTVSGDNPRPVTVVSGTVTSVTFAVTCEALPPSTGSLELTTVTTGASLDPDGYTLDVDGGAAQPIGINATVSVASLTAGAHAVRLQGVSTNCTVGGDNPRAATVTAGSTVRLTFTITCLPSSGSLQVTTTTSGAPPDPDGYSVSVDGGTAQAVAVAASVTFGGLEPKNHSVRLAGLAANCQVQGENPRDVTVVAGETATTTFTVTCAPTTGTLELTVSGLPAGTDAAVTVSGPGGFSAAVKTTTTLTALTPGTYTVAASDVVSGGTTYTTSPASRTVTVAAGATARVTVGYGPASGPSLNLRIDGMELTQGVQTTAGDVPMVEDRDGFLRVFVVANEANTAAPSVRVRVFRNGAVQQTLTISAPGGSTPTSRNEGTLESSWNVKLPRSLFEPGLAILAEVDPGNAIAENDETDNLYPSSGTAQAETVRAVPELGLRFVPVRQQTSGSQGNIAVGTRGSYVQLTRRLYPISTIDSDVHAVYTTTTTDALQPDDANGAWATILSEVDALRVVEGTSRTYYGVVHLDYSSGIAGLGFIGRPTAMGYDAADDQSRVMAHELGHTWHRLHSPCGQPQGVDPAYPYAGGTIGAWGFDLQENRLRSPSASDVMGYCADPWISDYTYEGVLDYRLATQAAEARLARRAQPCLLVWGRIVNGRPVLEPAFEVVTRPSLPTTRGAYSIEGRSADGRRLFELSFDAAEVADDRHGSRHFAFAVPLGAVQAGRVASLRLDTPSGGSASVNSAQPLTAARADVVQARAAAGGVALRWDATAHPMALVRDPETGEVLSFARGGDIEVATSKRELDVVLSDRVGSRALRVIVGR